jgi:hypothetical protein
MQPLGDPAKPTVWEGRKLSLAATAIGRRFPSARYRVTPDGLHWTSGRLGTKPQTVPMWAVRSVEVQQSVQQRARHVGNVTVSLQHPDYTSTPTFVVLEDVERPRKVTQLIDVAARNCPREHDASRST